MKYLVNLIDKNTRFTLHSQRKTIKITCWKCIILHLLNPEIEKYVFTLLKPVTSLAFDDQVGSWSLCVNLMWVSHSLWFLVHFSNFHFNFKNSPCSGDDFDKLSLQLLDVSSPFEEEINEKLYSDCENQIVQPNRFAMHRTVPGRQKGDWRGDYSRQIDNSRVILFFVTRILEKSINKLSHENA